MEFSKLIILLSVTVVYFTQATPPFNPNLQMCYGAGLDCTHCSSCYPGGWCITNPGNKPKCLCMYGWTGPNAEWVPDTSDPAWGKNRIRADNCLEPCHYTHHVRNQTCVHHVDPIICDPKCELTHGKCLPNGKCQCCRGWSGPNGVYDYTLGTYLADYCDAKCPYLGEGIPNPGCHSDPNDNVPACNPKCVASDGECMADGRCMCCSGWTGPHAKFLTYSVHKGIVVADFCDVYCPYKINGAINELCVVPDYVSRRRDAGYKITV